MRPWRRIILLSAVTTLICSRTAPCLRGRSSSSAQQMHRNNRARQSPDRGRQRRPNECHHPVRSEGQRAPVPRASECEYCNPELFLAGLPHSTKSSAATIRNSPFVLFAADTPVATFHKEAARCSAFKLPFREGTRRAAYVVARRKLVGSGPPVLELVLAGSNVTILR